MTLLPLSGLSTEL